MDNIAVNSTGTNAGGWGVCPLRNTLNNTTINSISIKRANKRSKKRIYTNIY